MYRSTKHIPQVSRKKTYRQTVGVQSLGLHAISVELSHACITAESQCGGCVVQAVIYPYSETRKKKYATHDEGKRSRYNKYIHSTYVRNVCKLLVPLCSSAPTHGCYGLLLCCSHFLYLHEMRRNGSRNFFISVSFSQVKEYH